MNTYIKLICDA